LRSGIAAAVLLLGQIADAVSINQAAHAQGLSWGSIAWSGVRYILAYVCEVAGLGALIELVDQIRWNALSPEQRKQ
jgi:hypothetical protein